MEVVSKAIEAKTKPLPPALPPNSQIPIKIVHYSQTSAEKDRILEVDIKDGEMRVHVSAKAHEIFLKFPTSPKILSAKRFLFPIFVVSWAKDTEDLSRQFLLTNRFDELPRIVFVIIEKSLAEMFARHIFPKTQHTYLVCLSKHQATAEISLQVCKSLAEIFQFTFWWKLPANIDHMYEYMPAHLCSQKTTIARGMLYGQLVLGAIYLHIFSIISAKLKSIMFRALVLLSKLSNTQKVQISPEDLQKTFACLEILEEVESQDNFKDETAITLVNYLISLLSLPQCAEQEKDKEKMDKMQKELKSCSDYLNLLFACNTLTYVAQSYQQRAVWIHYPNYFNIVGYCKNLDMTLNLTLAQKDISFLNSPPQSAWAETQEHLDFSTFENQLRNAEENFAKKLLTNGRNAISLVRFAKTNAKNTNPIPTTINNTNKNTNTTNNSTNDSTNNTTNNSTNNSTNNTTNNANTTNVTNTINTTNTIHSTNTTPNTKTTTNVTNTTTKLTSTNITNNATIDTNKPTVNASNNTKNNTKNNATPLNTKNDSTNSTISTISTNSSPATPNKEKNAQIPKKRKIVQHIIHID
eukprot:Phypoly_transcript_02737.p1 GENE.Phypoly_transcript_02737~~Phypoly_transcript_02737.p1  ORF type:complete len:580 (-),score=107.74 Phypoly_transcript_02737:960-2699(-)